MKELVIGCGRKLTKTIKTNDNKDYVNPVTLDINPDHKPDVVWDLNKLPLPFEDNEFDEIHAYEVLEHVGKQGDYEGFFREFSEYYRILKPNGLLVASVPQFNSPWAWGDPSHTRIITAGTLSFLSQAQYEAQVGKTAMSDFRYIYKADLEPVFMEENKNSLYFVLKAVKPL